MKSNQFVVGTLIGSLLLAASSSLAAARTTNCEMLVHRYCRAPLHSHSKHHVTRTKNHIAYRATHQTGPYYDNSTNPWNNGSPVDSYRSHNTDGNVGLAPYPAQYPGGATYNFYGPTTNYFGPSLYPGQAYSSPPEAGYDDGDRLDPWHGYDHNRGLENGY